MEKKGIFKTILIFNFMIFRNLRKQKNLLTQGLFLVICACSILSCRTHERVTITKGDSYFSIKPNPLEPFTNPSLTRFIKENEGASIVVRDNKAASGTGVSANSKNGNLCTIIENALARNNFNVRDRQLFESVMSNMGNNIDYVQLHQKTGTDLIIEITEFDVDKYLVKNYSTDYTNSQTGVTTPEVNEFTKTEIVKNKKGDDEKITVPVSYIVYGYHIEIKIIMLRDNKIGGIYKYYYTPCTNGCKIAKLEPSLVYYENNPYKNNEPSQKVPDNNEELYSELSNFLTKTVIPAMMEDIKNPKN